MHQEDDRTEDAANRRCRQLQPSTVVVAAAPATPPPLPSRNPSSLLLSSSPLPPRPSSARGCPLPVGPPTPPPRPLSTLTEASTPLSSAAQRHRQRAASPTAGTTIQSSDISSSQLRNSLRHLSSQRHNGEANNAALPRSLSPSSLLSSLASARTDARSFGVDSSSSSLSSSQSPVSVPRSTSTTSHPNHQQPLSAAIPSGRPPSSSSTRSHVVDRNPTATATGSSLSDGRQLAGQLSSLFNGGSSSISTNISLLSSHSTDSGNNDPNQNISLNNPRSTSVRQQNVYVDTPVHRQNRINLSGRQPPPHSQLIVSSGDSNRSGGRSSSIRNVHTGSNLSDSLAGQRGCGSNSGSGCGAKFNPLIGDSSSCCTCQSPLSCAVKRNCSGGVSDGSGLYSASNTMTKRILTPDAGIIKDELDKHDLDSIATMVVVGSHKQDKIPASHHNNAGKQSLSSSGHHHHHYKQPVIITNQPMGGKCRLIDDDHNEADICAENDDTDDILSVGADSQCRRFATSTPTKSGGFGSSRQSSAAGRALTAASASSLPTPIDSIICQTCGKCRCAACRSPAALPSAWLCHNACHLSADSLVDTVSCMCCVKAGLYHCAESLDDSRAGGRRLAAANAAGNNLEEDPREGNWLDQPCSCSDDKRCLRWSCLGMLVLPLPCLLTYPLLSGLVKLVEVCYQSTTSRGCRCPTGSVGAATATTAVDKSLGAGHPETLVSGSEKRLLD